MRSMDWAEASRFLLTGTRTAKVATDETPPFVGDQPARADIIG